MRYTTTIDITELPQVYRNINARLLYLHMTLKCGYHDDDRDMLDASIRTLAADVGITIAATRHALVVLERAQLVKKEGSRWRVTKWLMSPEISKRVQRKKNIDNETQESLARLMDEAEEHAKRSIEEVINSLPTRELRLWVQELKDGINSVHGGRRLKAHPKNIEYLENVLKSR